MTRTSFFFLGSFLALTTGCTLAVDDRLRQPECLEDADCPTVDVCAGPRVCDAMSHACVSANQALSCDDGEPCTTDSCDPAVENGCVFTLDDGDADGYAPETCTTAEYADKGGDCDDANNMRRPGGIEQCGNLVDDDCDGIVDTDAPATVTCYRDADGDGFANPFDSMTNGCSCPDGYIQPHVDGPDCADGVADANPHQTNYSEAPYCVNNSLHVSKPAVLSGSTYVCTNDGATTYSQTWDWNCNDVQSQAVTGVGTTCGSYVISSVVISAVAQPIEKAYCSFSRWDSNYVSSPPGCGGSARMWVCSGISCSSSSLTRTQRCL